MSLNLQAAPAGEVERLLSEQLQDPVSFFSDDLLTIDAKRMPADELLHALGRHGAVLIRHGGPTVAAGDASLAQPFTLLAQEASAELLSTVLSAALERSVRFQADTSTPLSIEVKYLPLVEILEALAVHGALDFTDTGPG